MNCPLEIEISGKMKQDLKAMTDTPEWESFIGFLDVLINKNRERLEKIECPEIETTLLRGDNRRLNRLKNLRSGLLSSNKAATA